MQRTVGSQIITESMIGTVNSAGEYLIEWANSQNKYATGDVFTVQIIGCSDTKCSQTMTYSGQPELFMIFDLFDVDIPTTTSTTTTIIESCPDCEICDSCNSCCDACPICPTTTIYTTTLPTPSGARSILSKNSRSASRHIVFPPTRSLWTSNAGTFASSRNLPP